MSNLPPGVTESMIPGNRPEDLAAEALWERIYDEVDALGITMIDTKIERIVDYVVQKIGETWSEAFADGMREAEAMQQQAKCDRAAREYFSEKGC